MTSNDGNGEAKDGTVPEGGAEDVEEEPTTEEASSEPTGAQDEQAGGKEEQSADADGDAVKAGAEDEADEEQPSIYEGRASQSKIDSKMSSSNNAESDFPPPFFCPITKKVMEDPVVLPDGKSYERSAISDKHPMYYTNRALKAVIDETVEMSGKSIRAGMKRIEHSMRQTFNKVLEKSIIPSEEYRPLPDVYYCPITFSIIHDPVIDPEGNTFERVAVENWIRANNSSPLTRTSLTVEDLYSNNAIKDLLDLEKGRTDASIHPSIRKWKEEKPPESTDPALGGNTVSADAASPFPTTEAELEEQSRRRRQANCNTWAALLFTAILVVYAFIYFGAFGIFLVLGCILCCICNDSTESES